MPNRPTRYEKNKKAVILLKRQPLFVRHKGGFTPLDPPGSSWALNPTGRNMSFTI